MITHGYLIESRTDANGRGVNFRLCVATEARAKEVADSVPGRTWRQVPIGELRDVERANLLRAVGEAP